MGFASYADYLASELWASIRSKVLLNGAACYCCGREATQVHHSAYRKKDLEGRDLRRLHPICARCHWLIEFRDGVKVSVKHAKNRMNSRRRQLQGVKLGPANPPPL